MALFGSPKGKKPSNADLDKKGIVAVLSRVLTSVMMRVRGMTLSKDQANVFIEGFDAAGRVRLKTSAPVVRGSEITIFFFNVDSDGIKQPSKLDLVIDSVNNGICLATPAGPVMPIERRSSYRLPVDDYPYYRQRVRLSVNELPMKAIDISGGGARFEAKFTDLKKDDDVTVSLIIQDQSFVMPATVVSVVSRERAKDLRIKFNHKTKMSQDKIEGLIFKLQQGKLAEELEVGPINQ
ncbi:MAG: PilZ domain-containing protein [Deltaproteobacteria bacterium]|nr:PilZ domain-containing protein [Deltaproteobacteria bacterium]